MRPVSQLGAGHKLWIGCCCEMLFWPVRCCFGHSMCHVVLASTLLFWPLYVKSCCFGHYVVVLAIVCVRSCCFSQYVVFWPLYVSSQCSFGQYVAVWVILHVVLTIACVVLDSTLLFWSLCMLLFWPLCTQQSVIETESNVPVAVLWLI